MALPLVLLAAADLATPTASPQSLRGAAPSPAGRWNCSFGDETAGMLTVEEWRYTLTIDGERASAGTLVPVGGQAIKNKAAYVRVESGPLDDRFGLGLGVQDDTAEPDTLFFNRGPGSGVRCIRT
ncbi:MAG: hypothetical protein WBA73_19295 [Devosia sp.]